MIWYLVYNYGLNDWRIPSGDDARRMAIAVAFVISAQCTVHTLHTNGLMEGDKKKERKTEQTCIKINNVSCL